jgi:hypothetical protein
VASGPWRMFLSRPVVLARGASGPCVGAPRCANYPRGPVVSPSLTHGCPFHLAATPRQLSSPKRGPLGPFLAPPHDPTVSESLWVRFSPAAPGTAWDSHRSAWLAIVPRRNHQPPYRVTTTSRVACRERRLRDAAVLRPAKGRGTSTWAETWLLPSCPGLAPPSSAVAGRRWQRTLPSGRFEPGFPHGHGPARVGLGRSGVGIDGTVYD